MPVPAILAALAAQGLGLLGNAVMAKGKEVIEEKLGVKIPDDPRDLTPDKVVELKRAEMAHEEFLVSAGIEQMKLEVEDRKSAREREARMNESEHATWLSKNTTSIIALIVVIGGGLTLNFNPDTEVKYAVVSLMSLVLGYYFGTSMGSTKAQQALRDMVKK